MTTLQTKCITTLQAKGLRLHIVEGITKGYRMNNAWIMSRGYAWIMSGGYAWIMSGGRNVIEGNDEGLSFDCRYC